jgi:tape measure domain-containing protein
VAYRADIEIAVRGAQELKRLQNEIRIAADAVDSLNSSFAGVANTIPRSINNLNRVVSEAAASFNKAVLGTEEASAAALAYVKATNQLNDGLRERLRLIRNIEAAETAAQRRIVPTSNAGYGQQTPALPPVMVRAKEIQQSWGTFFREAAEVGSDLKTTAAAKAINLKQSWNTFFTEAAELGSDLKTTAAAKAINLKQSWNTFFTEAAELGNDLKTTAAAKAINLKQSWNTFFTEAQKVSVDLYQLAQSTAAAIRSREGAASAAARARLAAGVARPRIGGGTFPTDGPAQLLGGRAQSMLPGAQAARRTSLLGGIGGRVPSALSSGIIGGGFPLLFGQGAGAAAGGALGGVAGGLLGGGFGFALSIAGTAIGDLLSKGKAIKQLGQDLGFSAQQAQTLATAFKTANTDVERFTAVVQNIRGLGLELQDQAELIKLTTALTEKYGGQFDKVGNAITSALESGKVSQATLNQLTSQGINVQQALADKLGVSRDKLLEMAKKGKIGIQDLVDVLVDMGNKGIAATKKPASGMEQLAKAASGLGSALGALGGAIMKALAPPLNWLSKQLAFIINLAAQGISAMANLLSGGTAATAAANARARQRLAAEGGPSAGTMYVAAKYQGRLKQLEKEEQAKAANAAAKINKINVSSLGQAAPSGAGAGNAESAKQREAKRLAALLLNQRAITAELKNQYNYNAKIFATESAKDPMLARRLQGEQQLVKWGIETAKLLEKEKTTAGQLAIAKTQQAKQALIRQQTEQDLARMELERLAPGYERQTQLQEENYLLQASLAGNSKQVELELRKAAILKGITDPAQAKLLVTLVEQNEALKTAADKLQMEKDLFGGIASTVAGVFDGALTAAVRGTEELGAALQNLAGDLLFTIGRMLIMYGIAQALGALGGGDKVGIISHLATAFGFKGAKDGAYWSGGFQAFADGGMVTRPTMGLVGEGGQPEYIIPASKMRGAMNRYAAGARGSAVIPAGSDGGDGMTATVAAPGAIDVRYTVERINSVDYVTADQFQRGMQQAAAQGAAQGEQRTLRRLQSSTSTRKRLGM